MSAPELPPDIAACLDAYFAGMARASRPHIERAFHPAAQIAGPDEGALATMDRETFVQLVLRQPPVDAIPHALLSLSVHGDIATAVVRDTYLSRVFIDHLALVRLGGEWRILHKLWHVERRL